MDIIDVLVSRALTPQVQIEAAAAQATKAVSDANAAVAAAESAEDKADALYDDLGAALTTLSSDINTAIDNKLALLDFAKNVTETEETVTVDLSITLTNAIAETVSDVVKYYQSVGDNIDGTMTQRAISEELNSLSDRINSVNINLGIDNVGKLVSVDEAGHPKAGVVDEEALVLTLLKNEDFKLNNAVGLQIDYKNRIFKRTQEAKDQNQGNYFNKYNMYGGRVKCNVSDNGTITAFYGSQNYTEDGSNGQVMIYQPKFYYCRVPIELEDVSAGGKVIRKEAIALSDEPITGFKLHPIFIDEEGEELDYVLFSAYEGSSYSYEFETYDITDSANVNFDYDQLSSIAGVKPISGVNKSFNSTNAEQMAANRGIGWHITNLAAVSANQMLAIVELGTLNSQEAVELGVCNLTNSVNANCGSYTGSTAALGNGTGYAEETINEINGTFNTYSANGYRSVAYRGMENPWGNMWQMIAGVNVVGGTNNLGGIPYICKNFTYSPTENTNDYESLGFCLPFPSDWISGFGYNNPKYDWVFMPIECSGANSYAPVGDNVWTIKNSSGIKMLSVGGQWFGDRNDGLFYYAADQSGTTAARSINARLMYIPPKNGIYYTNINRWINYIIENRGD